MEEEPKRWRKPSNHQNVQNRELNHSPQVPEQIKTREVFKEDYLPRTNFYSNLQSSFVNDTLSKRESCFLVFRIDTYLFRRHLTVGYARGEVVFLRRVPWKLFARLLSVIFLSSGLTGPWPTKGSCFLS